MAETQNPFSTASSQPSALTVEILKKMMVDLGTFYDMRKTVNADYLFVGKTGELEGLITEASERDGKYWIKLWSPNRKDDGWIEVTDDAKIYAVEVKKPKFDIRIEPEIYRPSSELDRIIWMHRLRINP